jgi:uncharacterized hydrophobic protein (TIGR00271 family)
VKESPPDASAIAERIYERFTERVPERYRTDDIALIVLRVEDGHTVLTDGAMATAHRPMRHDASVPNATLEDVPRMRAAVFFEGPEMRTRLSRFWLLLVLASCIAATGVVADSTATVIGAMIVAPLMTPILGIMLAVVLGDRDNLMRSIVLVVTGALVAIAVGFVVGLIALNPVLAETNGQVAARVTPRLIDLLAAFATGAVGSIALVRRDISDTLPGVAIAISLVPPLTVAGLALESGSAGQAAERCCCSRRTSRRSSPPA